VSCDGLGVVLVAVLYTRTPFAPGSAAADDPNRTSVDSCSGNYHFYDPHTCESCYSRREPADDSQPLHSLTICLEKKWFYLWAMVWTLAFGAGVLGFELYGYAPSASPLYNIFSRLPNTYLS